jgi:hypothetical protein
MMSVIKKIGLLCSAISMLGFTTVTLADDHFDDDWKISVSGGADAGGSISFTLTFEAADDGTVKAPITIDTPVAADASEDDIADLIGNSFKASLGEDEFDVDVSWGEHVKVEANGDTPDFVLTIANNTLQGVSIEIQD